jgi:2-(1,2-epoxy-1,2-dihydrophenyl)acetyl-CoA isomerase
MTEAPVLLTRGAGVATITLNRPGSRNALDTATKRALLAALQDVSTDAGVRCVVLTGSGAAFCSGQDLKEHLTALQSGDVEELWRTVPDHYNPIASAIADLPKPIIAAVNGVAAGAGASLAFLTDYRLLGASARVNVAFARIGLSCDTGTSWTLPRLVGPTRAMELLLSGRTVEATEALSLGIASEVVADDAFSARTAELAATLAAGPTMAFAAIREAVAYSATHPLAEALAFEAQLMRRTGESDDHRRAVEAFVAKRPPEFTGH